MIPVSLGSNLPVPGQSPGALPIAPIGYHQRIPVGGPPSNNAPGPSLEEEVARLRQENEELRARLEQHESKSWSEKFFDHPAVQNLGVPLLTAIATGLGTWFVTSRQSKARTQEKIDAMRKLFEERRQAEEEAAAVGQEALDQERQLTERMMAVVANGG